jgi:hypothetical protein
LSVARRLPWEDCIDYPWKETEERAHRVCKMLGSLGKALRSRADPISQEPKDPVPARGARP